ncbi:MAG: hypothetical protein IPJ65_13530 [Archangiaceae bacterium]|nr:hypothetical protein [Archangiaceae bacterium]
MRSWQRAAVAAIGAVATAAHAAAPVEQAAPEPMPAVRRVGIAVTIAGGAALATGAAFGVLSAHDRSRFEPGADGVIRGVTQRDAAALARQVSLHSAIANALLAAGAFATALGVVLVTLAPTPSTEVTLVPFGAGVAARGCF